MYEKLLREVELYLRKQNNTTLSIKKVWDHVSAIAKKEKFDSADSAVDFECLLEADHRFEVVSANITDDVVEETNEDEIFGHDEMEQLGFGGEQLVRLRKAGKNIDDDDFDEVGFAPHAVSVHEHAAAHVHTKKITGTSKSARSTVKNGVKKKKTTRSLTSKKGKRK